MVAGFYPSALSVLLVQADNLLDHNDEAISSYPKASGNAMSLKSCKDAKSPLKPFDFLFNKGLFRLVVINFL